MIEMIDKILMRHLKLSLKKKQKAFLKRFITFKDGYLQAFFVEEGIKFFYDKPALMNLEGWKDVLEDPLQKIIMKNPRGNDFIHIISTEKGLRASISPLTAKKLFGYDVSGVSIKLWLELSDECIWIGNPTPLQVINQSS